jgi:sterol 3beta-glucosyltransferase
MKSWGGSEDLNKYKDFIFCIDSVPHDWLFPKMKAVVHHGGAGTCGEGFRTGIPTMVLPFFGDQFLWANRVEEMGIGLSPFPFKKMSTAKLTSAIDKLVNDPGNCLSF